MVVVVVVVVVVLTRVDDKRLCRGVSRSAPSSAFVSADTGHKKNFTGRAVSRVSPYRLHQHGDDTRPQDAESTFHEHPLCVNMNVHNVGRWIKHTGGGILTLVLFVVVVVVVVRTRYLTTVSPSVGAPNSGVKVTDTSTPRKIRLLRAVSQEAPLPNHRSREELRENHLHVENVSNSAPD